MMSKSEIISLIFEVLEALNRERAPNAQIPISESTELLSDSSLLDSLAFVSFTADLEDRVNSKFGRDLSLVDTALNADNNSLSTVGSLADHIMSEVNRQ